MGEFYSKFDKNHDYTLSRDEFLAGLSELGGEAPKTVDAFFLRLAAGAGGGTGKTNPAGGAGGGTGK